MDVDDLKEKYKQIPMWGRIVGGAVLGLLPALWIYTNDGEGLQTELTNARNRVTTAQLKFDRQSQKKQEIPKLEQQLAFTEEQLDKAKKSLPDDFNLEDILIKTATIAKESGVQLFLFKPGESERQSENGVTFVELPIETEIKGKFQQIASFMDKIVHLETSVFIRNFRLARIVEQSNTSDQNAQPANGQAEVSHEDAVEARRNMKMGARFAMILFRGESEAEALQNAAPAEPKPGEGAPAEETGAVNDPGTGKIAANDRNGEAASW